MAKKGKETEELVEYIPEQGSKYKGERGDGVTFDGDITTTQRGFDFWNGNKGNQKN